MTITPEQVAAFEALQDPDDYIVAGEKTDYQFDWGEDYQRSVLSLLLADRIFLLQSIDLIKPDYFTNKAQEKIASVLFKHFREYRTVPTPAIFSKEMRDLFKDDETKFFYLGELQLLYDSYEPGIDTREYHQKEIFNFAKMVALKKAFHRSMKELQRGKPDDESTWAKIDKWIDESRVVDMHFDIGLDYFGSVRDRYLRMKTEQEHAEIFTTGFKPLDDEMTFGGMRRGEGHAFMAPPGIGKSLCLAKCVSDNIKQQKKVLFMSCEMNQDDVAARFDSMLTDVGIRHLIDNEETVSRNLSDYVNELEDKRLLIIKHFPSGTADVNTIRAYTQQLQMVGWVPDMVIVDYVGEMKDAIGMPLYESREKLVKELCGFASEYNICMVMAIQPNRNAELVMKEGGVIGMDNLGDSYGQSRPLSGLLTICQTLLEKKALVARIHVAKLRNGKSGWTFYVSFCQETLRFTSISEKAYRVRMSQINEDAVKGVKVDEVKLDQVLENRIGRWKKPEN